MNLVNRLSDSFVIKLIWFNEIIKHLYIPTIIPSLHTYLHRAKTGSEGCHDECCS